MYVYIQEQTIISGCTLCEIKLMLFFKEEEGEQPDPLDCNHITVVPGTGIGKCKQVQVQVDYYVK